MTSIWYYKIKMDLKIIPEETPITCIGGIKMLILVASEALFK